MKMRDRKAVIGLCTFVALLACVVMAQGATAAKNRLFTCKKGAVVGANDFSREHCKAEDVLGTTGKGPFQEISVIKQTEFELTNAKTGPFTETPTNLTVRGTRAGIELEFQATSLSSTGLIENTEEEGEEVVKGTSTLHFTGVTVLKPAGKGCEVESTGGTGGAIDSELLATTTKGEPTRSFKVAPGSGTVLAKFKVKSCTVAALNGTYELTGSITFTTDGATATSTEAGVTEQGTLFLSGQKAGLAGTYTTTGRLNNTEVYTPVFLT
jgi:hypothetical protein